MICGETSREFLVRNRRCEIVGSFSLLHSIPKCVVHLSSIFSLARNGNLPSKFVHSPTPHSCIQCKSVCEHLCTYGNFKNQYMRAQRARDSRGLGSVTRCGGGASLVLWRISNWEILRGKVRSIREKRLCMHRLLRAYMYMYYIIFYSKNLRFHCLHANMIARGFLGRAM